MRQRNATKVGAYTDSWTRKEDSSTEERPERAWSEKQHEAKKLTTPRTRKAPAGQELDDAGQRRERQRE